MAVVEVHPNDTIKITFNPDLITLPKMQEHYNNIRRMFPDNTVIGIVEGVDIETEEIGIKEKIN